MFFMDYSQKESNKLLKRYKNLESDSKNPKGNVVVARKSRNIDGCVVVIR